MKTYILSLFALVSAVLLSSCMKEELNYMLYTDTDKVVATPAGGVYEVAVRSNSDWTAELVSQDRNDWISLDTRTDSGQDDVIVITIDENTVAEDRVAAITVKAGTEAVSVSVVQKSAGSYSMDVLMANNYYGDQFSNGAGYVELDLRGGDLDYSGKPQGIAQIVKLALYTEMAADPDRAQIQADTYVLSDKNAGEEGTFFAEDDASGIWCYDQWGNISYSPLAENSTIRITSKSENSYSIVGEFFTEAGDSYDWYYEGNIKLINANHLTTDKDGYTIMRYNDGGLVSASFQGDVDGFRAENGTVKYVFDVRTKSELTNFGFNIAFYRRTDWETYNPTHDQANIVGTYDLSASRGTDYSLEEGNVGLNGQPWGCYYYAVDNVKTVTHMVTGGTMTVARYDEDEYDIKFDLMGENAPGAGEESLGKYRYIGPLPFSEDTPKNYYVYTPMGVEASYVVSNTSRGIARYDIYLVNNATSHYGANAEYIQISLYSEAPRDAEGNVIDETEASVKGAISNIETGTYTMAYNSDFDTDPSDAKKFTWEMIHFTGFYPKGTSFTTWIDGKKTTLVPYAGTIEVVQNDDKSYNITIENMPAYNYETGVPAGIINVSSMNIVVD